MPNEVYISQEATLTINNNTTPFANVAAPTLVRNLAITESADKVRLIQTRRATALDAVVETYKYELSFDCDVLLLSTLSALAWRTPYQVKVTFINTKTAQSENWTAINAYLTLRTLEYQDNGIVKRRVILMIMGSNGDALPTATLGGKDISTYLSRYRLTTFVLRPGRLTRSLTGAGLSFTRATKHIAHMEFDMLSYSQKQIIDAAYVASSVAVVDYYNTMTMRAIGDLVYEEFWLSNGQRWATVIEFEEF